MGGTTRFTVYTVYTLKFNTTNVTIKRWKIEPINGIFNKICYLQLWFGQKSTLNYMTLKHNNFEIHIVEKL